MHININTSIKPQRTPADWVIHIKSHSYSHEQLLKQFFQAHEYVYVTDTKSIIEVGLLH